MGSDVISPKKSVLHMVLMRRPELCWCFSNRRRTPKANQLGEEPLTRETYPLRQWRGFTGFSQGTELMWYEKQGVSSSGLKMACPQILRICPRKSTFSRNRQCMDEVASVKTDAESVSQVLQFYNFIKISFKFTFTISVVDRMGEWEKIKVSIQMCSSLFQE